MEDFPHNNKRLRSEFDDSLADSAESKLARVNNNSANEIEDELLNILEDSEAIQGGLELDSFIRSFEEEIKAQPPSDENESPQVELGYLLEASDDELGLPPTAADGKVEAAVDFVSPGGFDMEGDLGGFGDEIPCYDSFELGIGIGSAAPEESGFVALGGLFDYSDAPFWPESLSAL